MSHHYSYPDSMFLHEDVRLDLTDLYAVPKPGRRRQIDPDHEFALFRG